MMFSYENFSVLFWEMTHLGEGGWCSGESTHLPSLWPGFNSRTWRQMWIEFLFGSCPCSKGFSVGPLVFLPPQKPTFQIPIWPGNSGQKESPHGSWTAKLLLLSSSSLLLSVSYLVLFVLFPATQQFIGQRLLRTRWIQLGSHLLSMPEHFAMEIMIGKYNVLWLFIQSNLDYPDLLIIWTCFSGPIFQEYYLVTLEISINFFPFKQTLD